VILVDTSVWIDHLRTSVPALAESIDRHEIVMHPMVVGELACGNLPDRTGTLAQFLAMPSLAESSHTEVLAFIESNRLMGRGIGYVDAHLLCSALAHRSVRLWTHDQRLGLAASNLGIGHAA